LSVEWWQAIILGIVEGLTEYLPVSSTGHLLVLQALLGIGQESAQAAEAADAYAICIQAGAIIAVAGIYYRRLIQMGRGVLGKDEAGRRLVLNILLAFAPAVVIGLLFNELIKSYLFGIWPIVFAWIVGGLAILLVGGRKPSPEVENTRLNVEDITWRMALIIGLMQCIAMWPGTSRSLITLVAGILVGLRVVAAVEFSFILGLITLSAATVYDGVRHGDLMLAEYGWLDMALGLVFAFIAAVLAVKWLLNYLKKHSLAVFGWYRIGIGVVTACLVWMGIIDVMAGEKAMLPDADSVPTLRLDADTSAGPVPAAPLED